MFNYFDNYSHMPSPPRWVFQIDYVAEAFYIPVSLIIMFNAGVLLVRMMKGMLQGKSKQKESFSTSRISSSNDSGKGEKQKQDEAASSGHENDSIFFPFVYVLSGFVALIIIMTVISVSKEWSLLLPTDLFVSNCAYIIMELCILNFFLRRVKYEALTHLHALLQSKKQYVRYIR